MQDISLSFYLHSACESMTAWLVKYHTLTDVMCYVYSVCMVYLVLFLFLKVSWTMVTVTARTAIPSRVPAELKAPMMMV